jgi:hypothetical protein
VYPVAMHFLLMIYLEPEARDKIYQYPPTHVKTQNTFILASMNYFDSDMSKSTNTIVYIGKFYPSPLARDKSLISTNPC